MSRAVWVVGTFDTKPDELHFVAQCLREPGVAVRTADVATAGPRGRKAVAAQGDPAGTEADAALFEALQVNVRQSGRRRIVGVPAHINDPAFGNAVVEILQEMLA